MAGVCCAGGSLIMAMMAVISKDVRERLVFTEECLDLCHCLDLPMGLEL